jgi:nitrogenase molybdenum-iron protein beta chain
MSKTVESPRWTCALGGALAAAGALPRTIPIMHSGPGCSANFAWTQNGASGLQVGGRCAGLTFPGTNMQEGEIVFGGAERLHEELTNSLRLMDGDLYFVLTGCIPEVIGDDVESVVNEFASAGQPVVMASTAGFKGTSYFGYEQVLKTLFKKIVKPDAPKKDKLINIWGVPPLMDVFWKGNLKGVRDLLGLLGFEANIFFGPENRLRDIENASGARLNLVLSEIYGVEAAGLFKQLHGVDFITTPLPLGAGASERFLRTMGQALDVPAARTERIIKREGQRHYEYIEPIIDVYNDMEAQRYAIVIGDANYAFSLADFLAEDMGWLPEMVIITDELNQESKDRLLARRQEIPAALPQQIKFLSGGREILAELDEGWLPSNARYPQSRNPIFVLGSSLDRSLAAYLGGGHLSVSFPVSNRAVLSRGYTGYSGGLLLMEDVINAFILGR